MKKHTITLILEDKKMTSLLRCFDLFEDFKFLGIIITADKKNNKFISQWIENEELILAAQIIGNKYKINPAYQESWMSTGYEFAKLKNFCELFISS